MKMLMFAKEVLDRLKSPSTPFWTRILIYCIGIDSLLLSLKFYLTDEAHIQASEFPLYFRIIDILIVIFSTIAFIARLTVDPDHFPEHKKSLPEPSEITRNTEGAPEPSEWLRNTSSQAGDISGTNESKQLNEDND